MELVHRDASWSEELRQATREAIAAGAFDAVGDKLCFKHIRSGFGIIALDDLLGRNLRLVERGTSRVTVFADAEELIHAGWAID